MNLARNERARPLPGPPTSWELVEVSVTVAVRYPIGYELRPTQLAPGEQYIWLHLSNVGEEPITDLTVWLVSRDASRIEVIEPPNHIPSLPPGQDEEIGFEVDAAESSDASVRLQGELDGAPFRWESSYVELEVVEADEPA